RRIRLGIRLSLTERCQSFAPPPGTGLSQGDTRERVGCFDVAAQPERGLELRNTAVVVTALDGDVTCRGAREQVVRIHCDCAVRPLARTVVLATPVMTKCEKSRALSVRWVDCHRAPPCVQSSSEVLTLCQDHSEPVPR